MGVFRWYIIPLVTVVLAAVTGLSIRLAELLPAVNLPIQFSAGVAVAALLINGLRCWPGVFLGVYGATLWAVGSDGHGQALYGAVVMTGQALVGALLVQPQLYRGMARDREVLRFLVLAGPVACSISAAATQIPHLLGWDSELLQFWAGDLAERGWLTAWSANTLGVLVVVPPTLALWPGVRDLRWIWGARVVVPLLLAGLLVVVGHAALFRFEVREVELENKARLESVLQGGLTQFDLALEALHSVEHFFQASGAVSEEEFATFTARILRWPGLESIEWVPKVVADHPAAVEESFTVAVNTIERYPSLYTVSDTGESRPQVADYREIPTRWSAMEAARDDGEIVAAEPQPLMHTGRPGLPVVLPLYQLGFDAENATVAERRAALRGFIKGNFDLASLVEPLSEAAAGLGVRLALVDLTPGSPPMILLSRLPPEASISQRHHFTFAGRLFQLDLLLQGSLVPGTGPVVRLYQVFSVLAVFLIALAVLAAAGRHRAAEAMVLARTAALRASERHLEVTLDSIGDGVLVVDTKGFVTRLNPMAEQLTGWRSRQAQGRPLADVFHIVNEESRQPATVSVAEVLASDRRKGLANHTVLIDSEGVERAIAHSAAPILGAEGEPLGVVLVFRDISEERLAKRALEASEQRYRELIEQAPYGVFVQTGGRFSYLNPTALRLLGASDQAELLGRPVLDFLHPESRDAVAGRIHHLNILGIPTASQEEKWMRLDGSVFHAEATAAPHVHNGERGALVMLRDISARKAAETQRDRFFDLSLDPQCVLDNSGRFVRVNAAFSKVLGWSGSEFLQNRYLDLIHPEDRADIEREPGGIHMQNTTQRLEARFKLRGGGWRWLSWSAVSDEQGGLVYAVARDVTERRETIRALTRARQEAEYANRAKSAFLATMSHEIRTPMNAVVGLAEVLSHSHLEKHDEELVRNIGVSARSLLRLIDDILDFSKIEAGRLELERAPMAIEVVVEDLCQALLPMAREQGVSLSVFVAPELPHYIFGDDTRLRQLLNNLIGNAIKFSGTPHRGGGRVWVRVEPGSTRDTLKLTVMDNGIGMSRDTLEHIFQPFTQGELSTTRRYGGTGLGLAISKRLVELMGGEIYLDSGEGQGTTASVVLPFEVAETGERKTEVFIDLSGIFCVLVNTEELAATDWQRYLQSAGATAVCVQTFEEALSFGTDAGQLRVLILDLQEPAHRELPLNTVCQNNEDTRFVLVDSGRRGISRLQGSKMVVLEGGTVRRQQLLQAVALAAGRVVSTVAQRGDSGSEVAGRVALEPVASAHRILVVEDDDMNRKVISEQLSLLGYTAEVAVDGSSALALWREHRYDLVLSDLHMPEMDGYDFVRTLRNEERPPVHTPVIALTANAMHGEHGRALTLGFDDYLTKPISLASLDAALRHWLSPDTASQQGNEMEESLIDSLRLESPELEDPEVEGHAKKDKIMTGTLGASLSAEGGRVLDLTILRDFIGDDDARVISFVTDYRQAASQLRDEIVTASQQGDWEAVASFAHRLKSSSYWVGAVSLGKACEELEKAGGAGGRPEADDRLSRFFAIHDQTLLAIDRYLGATSA